MTGADGLPPPWRLQAELRRQLLWLITGLWLLASLAVGLGLWQRTDEVLDSALKETAERLLMLPEAALASPDTAQRLAMLGPHDETVVYQVQGAESQVLLRSHRAPGPVLDPGAPDGLRSAGPWLVQTLSHPDGQRRAQVAETTQHRRQVMLASVGWLLGVGLALVPTAALALHWLLRRAFASLEPARHDLAGRAGHDLRPLATAGAPAELQPWLATVNALLARVQGLVQAERSFAANTAHELRTPLAAAMAQAQRLVQASGDAGTREPAQALVRQLDRLTRLATRLLQLARIESGGALQREPVDLVQLAVLVVDDYSEAQRSGRLRLQVRGQPVSVQGDIDALGIALRNLIDNALKHGGDTAAVTVRVMGQSLGVEDDGPGVPTHLLDSLLGKFERGPGRLAVDGAGLGLAMVNTIAQQSGARLLLQSPLASGHGFGATLLFGPAATSAGTSPDTRALG